MWLIPMQCWPAWWCWSYLMAWPTAMASTLSEATAPLHSKTPSLRLITLHVQTLRLRPDGGRRPHYEMQAVPLHLVKPESEAS